MRFQAGSIVTKEMAAMLNSMASRLAALETRPSIMPAKYEAFRAKITSLNNGAITGVTNATPAEVTSSAHGLVTGDTVFISGVIGSTGVNGSNTITKTGTNTFTVPVAAGGVYVAGGTWTGQKYSWTERWWTSAGILEDKVNARVGVPEDGHAYERNNLTITDTQLPLDVEMRSRGSNAGIRVYEFDAPATVTEDDASDICEKLNEDTQDIRVVTNVCFDEESGAVTDVEYRTLTVARCLVTASARDCTPDPVCCPSGGYTCGCTTSNTLCFSWADAGVGGQVRLDLDTIYDNLDSFPLTMIADCEWAGSTVLPPEKIIDGTVIGPVNVDAFFGIYDGGGGSWFVCFYIRMWITTQYALAFNDCMNFETGYAGGIAPNTICPGDPIHQEYVLAQGDGVPFGEPFFEWGNHIDEGVCP